MQFSNSVYNAIKWVITIALPATGALYYGLAQVWHFPHADDISGTINVLIVFLGMLIGYSTRQYNKYGGGTDGDLNVNEVDGEKYLSLGVKKSVEAMTAKDTVSLRVVDNTTPL